jgi:hypothetical protein
MKKKEEEKEEAAARSDLARSIGTIEAAMHWPPARSWVETKCLGPWHVKSHQPSLMHEHTTRSIRSIIAWLRCLHSVRRVQRGRSLT